MESPIISLLSASGGAATFALAQDPLFPGATTTFYLLDPSSGQPVLTFPGEVPPSATLTGLNEQANYQVIAVSADLPDISGPSLMVPLGPTSWNTIKTVISAEHVSGAVQYELRDNDGNVLDSSIYPTFVDNQVFADELEASRFTYNVFGITTGNVDGVRTKIVERFRTENALCLITGSVGAVGGHSDERYPVIFRFKPFRAPSVYPYVQNNLPRLIDRLAYADYRGRWGAWLLSGSVVWCMYGEKIIEFVVPFQSSAELKNLPQVDRYYVPKNS